MAATQVPLDNAEPLIHYLYHPPSTTWQYIVADPITRQSVIIDPVLDGETSTSQDGVRTATADNILSEVYRHQYKVDHILETKCSRHDNRSAAWYIRMQLLESQKYAPQVSSGQEAVSRMGGLFARKYGRTVQSSLNEGEQFLEGQPFFVGQMRVVMNKLPGLCAPEGQAYFIGDTHLFGAHSIVQLKQRMGKDDFAKEFPLQTMSEDDCHLMWTSVQKILSLPPETQLHFDRGTPEENEAISAGDGKAVRFNEADENAETPAKRRSWSRSVRAKKGNEPTTPPTHTFTTAAKCKSANKDLADTSTDFMKRWAEKRADPAEKGQRR